MTMNTFLISYELSEITYRMTICAVQKGVEDRLYMPTAAGACLEGAELLSLTYAVLHDKGVK